MPHPLLACAALLATVTAVHWWCARLAYSRRDDSRRRLADLGFDACRRVALLRSAAWDAVPPALAAAAVLTNPELRTSQGLCVHLVTHAALLLLRCATFVGTQLPDASQEFKRPHVPWQGGTHDLCFSGHSAFVVLCACHVCSCCAPVPAVCTALIVVAYIASLVARMRHYTVDVVVAAYVTPLTWFAVRSGTANV